MKKLPEDAVKKRKQPRFVAGNDSNNGSDNTAKRQKKFNKAVQKQAKKIVGSVMEVEEADNDISQHVVLLSKYLLLL